jgi:Transcriptional regulator
MPVASRGRGAARRQRSAGRLRVDAAAPFMPHAIVPHVSYRARYSEVELELTSNDGIIDLFERRTGLAIRSDALRDSSLHARALGSRRLRVLVSPDHLARRGVPRRVDALARHDLLGFTQPESLNDWPPRGRDGDALHIRPALACSSGETLRQLAPAGDGIACLSDFMTVADRREGRLLQVLPKHALDVRQPIHGVYYRNTAVSARIASFLDHPAEALAPAPFAA